MLTAARAPPAIVCHSSCVIGYEDDHEEEVLQPDGETVEKVMINEASTLVDTVINLKVPPDGFGSEKTSVVSRARMTRGRVVEQTFLRTCVLHGLSEEGRRKRGVTIAYTPKETRTSGTTSHRCAQAQRFHPEHDHWRVAGRHSSHRGSGSQ